MYNMYTTYIVNAQEYAAILKIGKSPSKVFRNLNNLGWQPQRQAKKWEATEEWMPGACDSSAGMICVK